MFLYLCLLTENYHIMDINLSCREENITWSHEPDLVKLCFLTFSILIVLATFIFNAAVIIRLQLTHRHKHFTKFFLSSLAIADIFVGLMVIPFRTYGLFYDERYIFGNLTCRIMNSCDVMFTTVSIYHLSTLAFERYVAVRYPLSCNQICDKKTLIFLFTLCWIIPAAISFGIILPKIHVLGVEEIAACRDRQSKSCAFVTNIYFATLPGVLSIFLPILLIMFFNTDICITVRKHRALRRYMVYNSAANLHMSHRMFSQETRIALTIGLMSSVFLLCWLPFFILIVFVAARPNSSVAMALQISTWLGYANSAANPIMFLISDFCHKTPSQML